MELKYWGDNKLNKNKKEISVYFANWNLDRLPAEQSGEVAGIPWDCVTNIKHAFWQVAPADGTTETSFERRDRGEAPRIEFTIKSMWQKNDMEDQAPSAIDPSMPRNHFAQYKVFAKRYSVDGQDVAIFPRWRTQRKVELLSCRAVSIS